MSDDREAWRAEIERVLGVKLDTPIPWPHGYTLEVSLTDSRAMIEHVLTQEWESSPEPPPA